MKRFYLAVVLFLLPIILFLGGAEYCVRQIPNEYKYKNDWMEKHADEVEILILGHSHTELGVCPHLFGPDAFNIAISGRTPKYDLYMLEKWLNRFQSLKVVIMPIAYFSFSFQEPIGMNNGATLYKVYFGYPEHSDFSPYNVETLFFKGLHAKIHSYLNNTVKCNEGGWAAASLEMKDYAHWDNHEHVLTAIKGTTGRNFNYVEENCGYLNRMAEICRNHSIRLVFITTPIWHTYRKQMNKEQLSIMYDKISGIRSKYSLEYYDYINDPRFESDDFIDVQHLSDVGAKKFTNILIKDINSHNQ